MNYAPQISLSGTSYEMPNGMAGVSHTLGVMRALVNHFKIAAVIRQAAVGMIFLTPEKDQCAEVQAIFNEVRDNVRYVQDIAGVETIATPDKTLLCRIGDCDDQSLLLSTLLESVGYATRFVVAGYNSNNPEHVFVQILIDGEWVNADPTEHEPLGYAPPFPLVMYFEDVL